MSDYVQAVRKGAVGIIQLDRPRALNALDLSMVQAIAGRLQAWRDDPAVACVLFKGMAGRAFCAGGDVRAAVEESQRNGIAAAAAFFHAEYRLNYQIATFPKPIISLMDGITMGGGCGLSVHGRYRLVTENTLLAMPEAMIGFFPDVGAGYFLSRCPPGIGAFMALTGTRLGPNDALFAGLATHFLPSDGLSSFESELLAISPEQLRDGALDELLGSSTRSRGSVPAPLEGNAARIAQIFTAPSLDAVLARLQEALPQDPWAAEAMLAIRERSPLSCHLAWSLLARGRALDLADDLRLEYRLACRSLEAGEFAEGVRALLIDKDKTPRWRHPAIEAVASGEVEAFFQPFDDVRAELNLT